MDLAERFMPNDAYRDKLEKYKMSPSAFHRP